MGGVAGFVGTLLIGPRIGLFRKDTDMAFVLDEELILDDALLYISSKKEERSKDSNFKEKKACEKDNKLKYEKEGFLVDNQRFRGLVHKIALQMIHKEF